jgi:DNA-binding ferritin-like protein (Dps family)
MKKDWKEDLKMGMSLHMEGLVTEVINGGDTTAEENLFGRAIEHFIESLLSEQEADIRQSMATEIRKEFGVGGTRQRMDLLDEVVDFISSVEKK